jgi:hypothetical protein
MSIFKQSTYGTTITGIGSYVPERSPFVKEDKWISCFRGERMVASLR